jgi:2-oxo-3-hexenedioate decarboxylase
MTTTLTPSNVETITNTVQRAIESGTEIHKLTDEYPSMTVADGYLVQDELLRRWQASGRVLSGYKGGLTSKPKMQQMGVNVPAFGVLMGDTCIVDGGSVAFSSLIHPKIEAEIAFVTARELSGSVSIDEVLAATDFVLPAMEVIDSRYKDFKFDLPSVIADNTSAARYVVGGAPRRVKDLDLRLLGVAMEKNGELVGAACGAAVMNHPAASVAALVRHLGDAGRVLPAGSLVMTGGVTEAVMVAKGDHVTTRIQHLGTVGIRFT